MENVDVIVVGAGVVGLAIAAKLSKVFSNVLIVEKNAYFGEETSSRNSEVIHAGIYYPKNSLKASLCVQGKNQLYRYCIERHIPYQKVGKFIVAHGNEDEQHLKSIVNTAYDSGVDDLVWTSSAELKKSEPEISASAALFSPSSGVIDVHSYMQSLLAQIEQNGGLFVANTQFTSAHYDGNKFTAKFLSAGEAISINTQYLINSGGLHSTAVANAIDEMPTEFIPQLHYCRGHYFSYSGKSPINHLIYPIPEKNGLGIHASIDMGGQLKFGPDTQYIENINYDINDALKEKFYTAIQRYFPNASLDKLQPAYSGIRPKLQGQHDGFCDFNIQTYKQHGLNGLINLFGIDSPGLTSSLAIAEYVEKSMTKE